MKSYLNKNFLNQFAVAAQRTKSSVLENFHLASTQNMVTVKAWKQSIIEFDTIDKKFKKLKARVEKIQDNDLESMLDFTTKCNEYIYDSRSPVVANDFLMKDFVEHIRDQYIKLINNNKEGINYLCQDDAKQLDRSV